jgi:hypothetical protein
VVCLVVAACGRVTPPDDGNAQNCQTEGFDGSGFDARWSVLAGAAPTTYDVSASRLFISDAPFATTPSTPSRSWIYDLDTDKANQLAWPQSIGGQDFTLTADLGWSSKVAELTLGGVGVSDGQGTIAAWAGMGDPQAENVGVGAARAELQVVGAEDLFHVGPYQEPGSETVEIKRVNGTAMISIDGHQVVTGAMPGLISNVVIVYVRSKDGTTLYDFGLLEIREVKICRP